MSWCEDKCKNITPKTGSDGEDAYVYIAYASDDQGSDFSLSPLDSQGDPLEYISIVERTSQATNDLTLHTNEGEWVKYIGDDGSNSGGSQMLYNDDTTQSTTNTNLTQLKSFSVPSGTIDSDGDAIRIKTALRKENSSDTNESEIELRIYRSGASSTFYTTKINHFNLVDSDVEGLLDVQLNRFANDGASADTMFQRVEGDGYQVTGSLRFFDRITDMNSTFDFNSEDLEIEVYANVTNGTINCDHLSVEYIPKSS